MRAMVLQTVGAPLQLCQLPSPEVGEEDLLLEVQTCGVCRTDLHIKRGEVTPGKLPLVLGHQVVGKIVAAGKKVEERWQVGQLAGAVWLGGSCGRCSFCRSGRENLCDEARFTGCSRDGGFAELCSVSSRFAVPLPSGLDPLLTAPLLCAGMIGYRAYREIRGGKRLGFYGFGSSAHLLLQLALAEGKEVIAFTRPNDTKAMDQAKRLGANQVMESDGELCSALDGALLFAPDGLLVPRALKAVKKGGKVVCVGIHMSDIPSFPYSLLWGERSLSSVANLTRRDAEEFLPLALACKIQPEVISYPLEKADQALCDLEQGKIQGSIVLDLR